MLEIKEVHIEGKVMPYGRRCVQHEKSLLCTKSTAGWSLVQKLRHLTLTLAVMSTNRLHIVSQHTSKLRI